MTVLALWFVGPQRIKITPKVATVIPAAAGPSTNAVATATNPPDGSASMDDAQLSDADKALKYLNQGTDFLNRGKIEEAAAPYAEAVRLDPEDEDAHYNLGLALAKLGKP